MFERFTEHARRVIFFARYEASQMGSSYIEPEHLLLGVLRERSSLGFALPAGLNLEQARLDFQAESPVGSKTGTSVDLPMSHTSKRFLAYAAEEAERLNHRHIGTPHLLLGLLRDATPASKMLHKHGFELESLRQQIATAESLESRGGDAITSLREALARIAQRLTPNTEPAPVYWICPVDRTPNPE